MTHAGSTGRAAPLAAVVATLAVAGSVRAEPPSAPPVVRYDGGLVTVQALRASRPDVVEALAREAGLVVQGDVLDTRPLSKRFEDLALPEALDRLLGEQNFALVYDDAGRPRRVQLLGLPEPPPERPARARRPKPQPPLTNPAIAAALARFRRLGMGRVPPPQARR